MRHAWIAVACCLVACHGQTPEQKLVKSAGPAASWVATLQLTAEQWTQNSVPTHFVEDTISAAQKSLDKTKQTIAKSDASPSLRKELNADVERANVLAASLRAALRQTDRHRATAPLIAQLHALHEQLDDLEEKYGE